MVWLLLVAGVRGFRGVRVRSIVAGALVLSTVIVAGHVPSRWNGGRTGEIADVPLRPLSAIEAAALLRGAPDAKPVARITALTDKTADISTRVYPLVSSVDLGECWPGGRHNGVDYQFCSSSWEDYHNVHRVARTALERELGRSLTAADVQSFVPGYAPTGSKPSFASHRFVAYFITEVVFLTALLGGVALALRHVRSVLLVPPIFTIAAFVSVFFVLVYSPAFVDADYFYQRIAVEELMGGRRPLGMTFTALWTTMPPLSLVCLPAYTVLRITHVLRQRRTASP